MRAVTRVVRARQAGPAIVEEAERRNVELIVMGAPRRAAAGTLRCSGRPSTMLKSSLCRVLLAAGRRAA